MARQGPHAAVEERNGVVRLVQPCAAQPKSIGFTLRVVVPPQPNPIDVRQHMPDHGRTPLGGVIARHGSKPAQ